MSAAATAAASGFSSIGRPSIAGLPPKFSEPLVQNSRNRADLISVEVEKYEWSPPADAANVPYQPHQEDSRYFRTVLSGIHSGLLKTFLLVLATTVGTENHQLALFTAISTGFLGALAAALTRSYSLRSYFDWKRSEFQLEREHIHYHRDIELAQLRGLLENFQLSSGLLDGLVAEIGRNEESLFQAMFLFQYGLLSNHEEIHSFSGPTGNRMIFHSSMMAGLYFLFGAIPSIIPYCFFSSPYFALFFMLAFVSLGFFSLGVLKTRLIVQTMGEKKRFSSWKFGLQAMINGLLAGFIAFLVGYGFMKISS